MNKTVRIGKGECGDVFCKIEIEPSEGGPRLSITGVEGPKSNGYAKGGCGQILDSLAGVTQFALGWTPELRDTFQATWRRWHLNDMRAGCEHQRAEGWEERPIDPARPCSDYIKHPGGGSGWNMLTWLDVKHGGLMCKPCPVCGYKYGTAWRYEALPGDVVQFLASLPNTDKTPAWV